MLANKETIFNIRSLYKVILLQRNIYIYICVCVCVCNKDFKGFLTDEGRYVTQAAILCCNMVDIEYISLRNV